MRTPRIHLPTLCCALAIFVASSIPHLDVTVLDFSLEDKAYHLVAYGVFGFFLQRSASALKSRADLLFLLLVFSIGLVYAMMDEVHQLFVPGRTFDTGDLIADGLGILFGQIVWKAFRSVPPPSRHLSEKRGSD